MVASKCSGAVRSVEDTRGFRSGLVEITLLVEGSLVLMVESFMVDCRGPDVTNRHKSH